MYKSTLLAAAMFAAVFSTTSNIATAADDPAVAAQQSTAKFMTAATNPYVATQPAPVAPKAMKKSKKMKM